MLILKYFLVLLHLQILVFVLVYSLTLLILIFCLMAVLLSKILFFSFLLRTSFLHVSLHEYYECVIYLLLLLRTSRDVLIFQILFLYLSGIFLFLSFYPCLFLSQFSYVVFVH